jgi:hypothetical protein
LYIRTGDSRANGGRKDADNITAYRRGAGKTNRMLCDLLCVYVLVACIRADMLAQHDPVTVPVRNEIQHLL